MATVFVDVALRRLVRYKLVLEKGNRRTFGIESFLNERRKVDQIGKRDRRRGGGAFRFDAERAASLDVAVIHRSRPGMSSTSYKRATSLHAPGAFGLVRCHQLLAPPARLTTFFYVRIGEEESPAAFPAILVAKLKFAKRGSAQSVFGSLLTEVHRRGGCESWTEYKCFL